MPHFHTTAVFEAQGTSLDAAERASAVLFQSLRHNRVHYYEHDVSAGGGPYASSKMLYFSVIAEFDVEAGTEDKAGEMVEEVLETLATDEVQLIAFGLLQGERRAARSATEPPPVRIEPRVEPRVEVVVEETPEVEIPAQAAPIEAVESVEVAESAEPAVAEERRTKKRSPRGRGRKRKDETEAETSSARNVEEEEPRGEEAADSNEVAPARTEEAAPVEEAALVIVRPPVIAGIEGIESKPLEVIALTPAEDAPPPLPPPRSSTAMRVKSTLSFRAAELGLPTNGFGFHDKEELLTRAVAEVRTRHPELPSDLAPEHAVVVQPWGEVILTLTWEYDVPVPSAAEAE